VNAALTHQYLDHVLGMFTQKSTFVSTF